MSQRDPTLVIPLVITDATAPALLGMSARQFRDAVARQRLPSMKLGQRTVVLVADLQRLAHANAQLSKAHRVPRDEHNRRRAAATERDDFMASIEHLDQRDAVNAILGRLGRRLTDEAYAAYGAGDDPRPSGNDARARVATPETHHPQARINEGATRREERAAPAGRPSAEVAPPPAPGSVRRASRSSTPRADKARGVAIIHPAFADFLDFLVEKAIKRWTDEQADKIRRGELIEPAPVEQAAKTKAKPLVDKPDLVTIEEAVARMRVSREEILAEFDKQRIFFEVTIPAAPRARRRASKP